MNIKKYLTFGHIFWWGLAALFLSCVVSEPLRNWIATLYGKPTILSIFGAFILFGLWVKWVTNDIPYSPGWDVSKWGTPVTNKELLKRGRDDA